MIKRIIILACVLIIYGCASSTKIPIIEPINIIRDVEPIPVLHPPLPTPVLWEKVTFTVLTPERMKELLRGIDTGELNREDLVFISLSTDGYENLGKNMSDIKRYITDQKAIIMYYKSTIPSSILLPSEDTETE